MQDRDMKKDHLQFTDGLFLHNLLNQLLIHIKKRKLNI
jgi:hypothetical protein